MVIRFDDFGEVFHLGPTTRLDTNDWYGLATLFAVRVMRSEQRDTPDIQLE